jgi:hypothetical protein
MANHHYWINYPNRQNMKCTVCGTIRKLGVSLSSGKKGALYVKNFIEYESIAPSCNNKYTNK